MRLINIIHNFLTKRKALFWLPFCVQFWKFFLFVWWVVFFGGAGIKSNAWPLLARQLSYLWALSPISRSYFLILWANSHLKFIANDCKSCLTSFYSLTDVEFQYPTFICGLITLTHKNISKETGVELYNRPDSPDRWSWSSSYNMCRIHTILVSTWNILQGRSYVRQQNKPQEI
jgi:hypothetical protein